MLDWFAGLVGNISNIMYSYVLIIMLLGVGLYFTFRTKFVQIRLLGESIRVITEKKSDDNAISSFQALMVSTASRVGTGNIIGVSTALCLGATYRINDMIKLNAGYMHSFYGNTDINRGNGMVDSYTRKNDVVGVSVDFKF